MKAQGRPGGFEYKVVWSIEEAERLQAQGWKLIQSLMFSERYTMERPKRRTK